MLFKKQLNSLQGEQITIKHLSCLGLIVLCAVTLKYTFQFSAENTLISGAVILLALSLLLFRIEYDKQHKSINIIVKGVLLMLGAYALTNYPGYLIESGQEKLELETLRIIAVISALVSLKRPAIGLFVIYYTIARKQIDTLHTGITLSPTDYMPVVEVALFLISAYLILSTLRHRQWLTNDQTHKVFRWSLFAAIGIHFGNYFHSAIAKLILDGGPLTWLLDNHTHYLIITSIEMGLSPIGSIPAFTQWLFDLFSETFVAFNFVTLIGQLVCIYFVTSVRKVIIITLFYDLMHITIYLLTGIFFWKWILLNVLIVAAMHAINKEKLALSTQFVGIVFTVFSIGIFFTAQLGWYDTKSLKHSYIEAVDQNNRTYRAPTNYFLNSSLTFTQGRTLSQWPGHFFLANSLGSTSSYEVMTRLNACVPLLIKPDRLPNYSKLSNFIKRHHQYVLSQIDQQGLFSYDIFPHHVWSNPLLSKDFYALDKRTIQSYRIVVESKCLNLNNGAVESKVIFRSESSEIYVNE